MKTDYAKLAISIIISHAAGIIGSVFTYPSIQAWYVNLQKPFFTPPSWLFAPAWLVLYTLMGAALYLVWMKGTRKKDVRTGMTFFGIQLALNALWSILFFGMRNPMLAFAEIIILIVAIAATMIHFRKVDIRAYYLMWPYVLWTTFAVFLNYNVWILNI